MKQLPIELWDEILIRLHQQDRVQAMLVCQQWNESIKRSHLFHTVRLSTLNGLSTFKALLKENPEKGEQVQRLVLDYDVKQKVILDSLMPLLPNVRDLLLSEEKFCFFNDTVEFPFHKTIRYINELFNSTVTKRVLSAGLCPALTTLSCHDLNQEVIPLLRNAPALENLDITLERYSSLRVLEKIHENAPKLKSLKVTFCELDGFAFGRDEEVTPAPLMTHFELEDEDYTVISSKYDLIAYIDRKYPNLTHLSCSIDINEDEAEEDIDDLFSSAWVPYLKKMAPQLHKLHIRGDIRVAQFFIDNKDERYHIGDQCLNMMEDEEEAGYFMQLHFLTKLKFYTDALTDYTWLSRLVSLTELAITYDDTQIVGDIKFNHLLKQCPPTLKLLKLIDCKYPFQLLDISPVNVESLIFDNCVLPTGIDVFISEAFPRLNSLSISGGTIEKKYFSLLNVNLSHFQLEQRLPKDNGDVEVITKADGQQRRYRPTHDIHNRPYFRDYDRLDAAIYPAIQSQSAHQAKTVPYFTLVCHSLENIVVLDDQKVYFIY